MTTKVDIKKIIRFSISNLGAENGASTFEHICRHFANARICKNILPSTGPVQAGGDQGRDFETFFTYIKETTENETNSATLTNETIVFACSLEKNPGKKNGKIISDVKSIIHQGKKPNRIYFFSGEDIPTAKRHSIIKQVDEQYSIPLEIIDANALSEQLACDELLWIANKYLDLPNTIIPKEQLSNTSEESNYTKLKKNYPFTKFYIKRYITDRIYFDESSNYYANKILSPENIANSEYSYNEPETNEGTFIELIELGKQKHFVLLSVAGYGKSNELEYIAHYFSNPEKDFYPIKISLNTIINQSIEDFLSIECNQWEKIPKENLLIILDGLDEVNATIIFDVFKRIQNFGTKHQESTIIVSCRNNFYTPGTDTENGSIKGFKSVYLNDINYYNIVKYVKENLNNDYLNFFEEVTKKKKADLLKNPFYLINLVKYFSKNNLLPSSSSDVLKFIIELKVARDKKHFEKTIPLFDLAQTDIFKVAEKIAIFNQCVGKNYTTEEELSKIENDTNILRFLNHSFIVTKDLENSNRRQFEHNNFQEYLAAKYLSRLKLEEIKQFITFKPDYKKIKPYWLNTLTHLLNILENDKIKFLALLKWLLEIDSKVLILLEVESINSNIREQIFITILNSSIEKRLSLYGEDFSFEELMRFSGGSKLIVDFLLEKTKTVKYKNNLIDCIELIANIKNPFDYEEKIIELFIQILKREDHYDIVYHTLNTIAKLSLYNDVKFINQIIDQYSKSKSSHKRSGLFELILKAPNSEELTLRFIRLTNILYKESEVYVNESTEKVHDQEPQIYNENEKLNKCFRKIISKEGLIELVTYFTKNRTQFRFEKLDKTPEIIIENLIEIGNDEEIFGIVVDWFKLIARGHENVATSLLKTYFTRTNTTMKAFKLLLSDDSDNKNGVWSSCYLVDKDAIDLIISSYKLNKIQDDTMYTLRAGIGLYNKEMFEIFYSEINKALNDRFIYPPQRDYEKERIDRIKEDIFLLFNKKEFERKADELFAKHGKQLNKDMLWEIKKSKQNEEELEENIVINTFRQIADEHFVTKDLLEFYVLNENSWIWFKLEKTYAFITDKNNNFLLAEHIEWVKNWCYENIHKADFINSVVYHDNGSYTFQYMEWYLFNFYFCLEIDFPKQKMIDMLSYGRFNELITGAIDKESKLFKQLSNEDVKRKVISYFKNKNKNLHLLRGYIKLIEVYSFEEGKVFLIDEIKNNNLDEWDKINALKVYLKIGGAANHLIPLVNNLNFKEEWNWTLLEILSKIKSVKALDKLREETNLNEENWIQISKALLKFKDKLGLKIVYNRLLNKNSLPYDYSLPIDDIVKINYTETSEFLYGILKFVYTKNYKFGKFHRIDEQVFRCFEAYINSNDELFHLINNKISLEILPNAVEDEKKGNLNFYLLRLEKSYYTNKKDYTNVDEIIELIIK